MCCLYGDTLLLYLLVSWVGLGLLLFFLCVLGVVCCLAGGRAYCFFGALFGFPEAFLWLKLRRRPLQSFKAVSIVIYAVNWHKRYP